MLEIPVKSHFKSHFLEASRQVDRGGENSVVGKRWFCLSDTRHFRHFHRFPGSEEESPCFCG